MKAKKITAVILSIVMVLLAFASCGKKGSEEESSAAESETVTSEAVVNDLAAVKAAGVLKVGVTEFKPIDYRDSNNEWTGFDADFAKAVAEKLGVSVEFVEIDWDSKYIELESNQIDCIWNGMTITDEVKPNCSVSEPYVSNKQVVVMKSDDISKYSDIKSLADAGLTFAVEAGSAGESAAKDAGLTTVEVNAQSDTLMEVKSGTADGAVIDATMAAAMTGEGTDYSNLSAGLTLTEELYGIGFRKGSDLTAVVDKYIDELKSDGTLKTLADKYGLSLAE